MNYSIATSYSQALNAGLSAPLIIKGESSQSLAQKIGNYPKVIAAGIQPSKVPCLNRDHPVKGVDALLQLGLATSLRVPLHGHASQSLWPILKYLDAFLSKSNSQEICLSVGAQQRVQHQRAVQSEEIGIAIGVLLAKTWMHQEIMQGNSVSIEVLDFDMLRAGNYSLPGHTVGAAGRRSPDYVIAGYRANQQNTGAPAHVGLWEAKGTKSKKTALNQLGDGLAQLTYGRINGGDSPSLVTSVISADKTMNYQALQISRTSAEDGDAPDTNTLSSPEEFVIEEDTSLGEVTSNNDKKLSSRSTLVLAATLAAFSGNHDLVKELTPDKTIEKSTGSSNENRDESFEGDTFRGQRLRLQSSLGVLEIFQGVQMEILSAINEKNTERFTEKHLEFASKKKSLAADQEANYEDFSISTCDSNGALLRIKFTEN